MANTIQRKGWNWFKDEGMEGRHLPVRHNAAIGNLPDYATGYFRPLSNFFSEMNQMFEHRLRQMEFPLLSGVGIWQGRDALRPNINIASNDNEYTITVETPGIEEKDIKLDVSPDGLLTISGEKRQESEDRHMDYECVECAYGAFQRTLSLPEDADHEAIEARFKNGLLSITCPRTEKARSKVRQIPIGTGFRATNANISPKKAA